VLVIVVESSYYQVAINNIQALITSLSFFLSKAIT
jgi:hypothetical protein